MSSFFAIFFMSWFYRNIALKYRLRPCWARSFEWGRCNSWRGSPRGSSSSLSGVSRLYSFDPWILCYKPSRCALFSEKMRFFKKSKKYLFCLKSQKRKGSRSPPPRSPKALRSFYWIFHRKGWSRFYECYCVLCQSPWRDRSILAWISPKPFFFAKIQIFSVFSFSVFYHIWAVTITELEVESRKKIRGLRARERGFETVKKTHPVIYCGYRYLTHF